MKSLLSLLRVLCEEMKVKYSKECCLYNLMGLMLQDDDIGFIQDGDEIYLEPQSRPFDMR